MDIGKLKNNYEYYNGFEGEEEIILECVNNPIFNIHIWNGYFEDIFDNPNIDGKGWHGFTRDYHQDEGAYSGEKCVINLKEYRDDLLLYKDKQYSFSETAEVFSLILDFLQYAIESADSIAMEVL